jgi:hypothetical protein
MLELGGSHFQSDCHLYVDYMSLGFVYPTLEGKEERLAKVSCVYHVILSGKEQERGSE